MGQSGQALGDRPETIEPQGIHRQAAECGQDLNAVDLAVAVRVFLELGVAGPVPGVLVAARLLRSSCSSGLLHAAVALWLWS